MLSVFFKGYLRGSLLPSFSLRFCRRSNFCLTLMSRQSNWNFSPNCMHLVVIVCMELKIVQHPRIIGIFKSLRMYLLKLQPLIVGDINFIDEISST